MFVKGQEEDCSTQFDDMDVHVLLKWLGVVLLTMFW
uniref:Uncharacterized protein n=1 Tax=Arundo donax TaxID=35708 RepID=A0A0A9FRM5_ARUDO